MYICINSHVQELMTLITRRSVYIKKRIKEHTFKRVYLSRH